MFIARFNRVLKYRLLGGATLGTEISINSILLELFTHLYGRSLDKTSEEHKELKSQCQKRRAKKLLKLCCFNKGVYIKVGQHTAVMDYLLPFEYVQTMKISHCHAPENLIENTFKIIKEELKQEPLEGFKSIDPKTLSTTSLAQVHKATLHNGEVVAGKFQHLYVQGNSQVDIKTIEILFKIMTWIFAEFKF